MDNLVRKHLEVFETITLEEMDKVKLMDRVESKFVLSSKQLPSVFKQIQDEYRIVSFNDNLCPAYRTVYYDSDDLFFYHEHHRKRKDRYKVRFRNYVESQLSYLEVKHKKNGRVDKQRIKVENEQFVLNEEEKEFLNQSNISSNDLKQKLTNNYNRITLVAKESIERVTFDLNIRFQYMDAPAELKNIVIVELKQPALSRETPIYKALKNLQVKRYNLSKYCIGIIKTHGKENVKYNRFKKKLLRINKITAI